MTDNPYVPHGLHLIPDHLLRVIFVRYRRIDRSVVESDLPGDASDALRDQLSDLRRATTRIEQELHARGIGAQPWWCDRRQPARDRPGRRVDAPATTVSTRRRRDRETELEQEASRDSSGPARTSTQRGPGLKAT